METCIRKKDITVIGAAIMDVLAGPASSQVFQTGTQPMERIRLSFGGDALNEAVALSRLGKRAELVSKVGKDEAGARILDYLKENGISPDCIRTEEGLETGINIVLIDETGERHFLTNPNGSLRKLAEADVEPYLDEAADIVSFASIFVSPVLDIPAMERVFRRVKARSGRILAADMTKAKRGERLEDLKGALSYVDYVFPNEEEAALLTGERDPYINARLFVEAGASCAVLKCGSRGCVICTGDELFEIPAYPVERAVDTTGAGDCFAAGFLWGLSEGFALADCGRLACAAASCAVECVGAAEGIRGTDEVMRRYKQMKVYGRKKK